jgi:hypothetical protein
MRCLTSHTTPCIYIHYWPSVLSNHSGPTPATLGCGGASHFFSWSINMFVFVILRIPSAYIHICSTRTAATVTPLATSLVWIHRGSPYAGPNFPVCLTTQLFRRRVFINRPECVLGVVWTASLTRRSRCTPSLNQLFIYCLWILWNILSCVLLSSCKPLRDPTVIRSCTAVCKHGYVPRSGSRNKSVLHELHCRDVRTCVASWGASIAHSLQRLGLTCDGPVNVCSSVGRNRPAVLMTAQQATHMKYR